jgi:hypothetical protein
MTIQKATSEQWQFAEDWGIHATRACLLELRDRVMALEAQANHIGDINKMVPPPVATDEELLKIWDSRNTYREIRRAIYDLGVAHGQASSQEVAEPAPVSCASTLVDRVKLAIDKAPFDEGEHQWNEARAAILEVAKWLEECDLACARGAARLLNQEAQ